MSGPWNFEQAQETLRRSLANQRAGEVLLRDAFRDYALAEKKYREALAVEMVKVHDDGVAWTAAADLARGDPSVAELRYKRDVAEGMKEAAVQVGWHRSAEQRTAEGFLDWSKRRELAEFHGPTPEGAIP